MTLGPDSTRPLLARLHDANREFAGRHHGHVEGRQPIHTVYGGAHLFRADTAEKLGTLALRALDEYAPDFLLFARALELPGAADLPVAPQPAADLTLRLTGNPAAVQRENPAAWLAHTIYTRVREKLVREPVEDFRVDFEDGYGNRPDEEEDRDAVAAAEEMAASHRTNRLPPFVGIRIKPLTEELHERSLRTLDLFVATLTRAMGGSLPAHFVVTLPKVTIPAQVAALADWFDLAERSLGLPKQSLRLEVMVEVPEALFGDDGSIALPRLVRAARGRCVAAHFGTYDYTAACGITATHQHMHHPACDFARHIMQVSLTGAGVWLSDGATNILPIPPHRRAGALAPHQMQENRAAVFRAWKIQYDDVRRSLQHGYYQGWDLHPAQLPARYAALFTFFLEGLEAAGQRLRRFVERAAQATLVGNVMDDAATGQGLLNYFLRAINCGALTEEEAVAATGIEVDELRARSFLAILKKRA